MPIQLFIIHCYTNIINIKRIGYILKVKVKHSHAYEVQFRQLDSSTLCTGQAMHDCMCLYPTFLTFWYLSLHFWFSEAVRDLNERAAPG